MDEPTNYLDVSHIDWLVSYLNDFPGAFIVVSHDYDFLGRITNCIIDIDFGTITRYTGTLKQAMRQKEANRQTYMKTYANQQRQIAKTEAYIRKNKAGTRAWFPWCQGRRPIWRSGACWTVICRKPSRKFSGWRS